MKAKLTILLILIYTSLIAAENTYVVDKVRFTETIKGKEVSYLPYLKSANGTQDHVTTKVNNYIKDRFMIRSFNPEYTDFRWLNVNFNYSIVKSHLHIEFSGEYVTDENQKVEDHMFFDLKNGNSIKGETLPFNAFFTLEGYFEFLQENWVAECKKTISDSDCKDNITAYDFDYVVLDQSVKIFLKHFPSDKNCNTSFERDFSFSDLKPFLNSFGKKVLFSKEYCRMNRMEKVLFYKENKVNLPENYFVTGRINDSYNVNIAINLNKKDLSDIKGYYFFEDKYSPIELSGEMKDNMIYLKETEIAAGNEFKFSMNELQGKTALKIGSKYLTAKLMDTESNGGAYLEFICFKMNK